MEGKVMEGKVNVGTQTDVPLEGIMSYSQEVFGMRSWEGMGLFGHPHYF